MKLSIITINYNNRKGLRKTIESVVEQTFEDFEYIIIDGGSNDGSVDVIKEYAAHIDYWVSEKDKGIYHAMNKGVQAAHGEYCMFLNSGDTLFDGNVLSSIASQDVVADIACGDMVTTVGRIIPAPEEVTMAYMMRGTLSHPASFIRRSLLMVHPFNEQSKIIGDREFFMYALIKLNASYQRLDRVVSVFDLTGVSSITQERDEQERQVVQSTEDQILLPRVKADYVIFMGEKDEYHRLFYLLAFSRQRKWVYKLIVALLKLTMFNRGFIKGFSINGKV